MSVLPLHKNPASTIVLSIFHRTETSGSRDEYRAQVRDFHRKVEEECEARRQQYQKTIIDAVARESQILRGSLSQFLTTPLKSDSAEVLRIISDSLQGLCNQSTPAPPGLLTSWAGEIHYPDAEKPAGKKLLQNGRAFLRNAGLLPARQKEEVLESVYLLSGESSIGLVESVMHLLSPAGISQSSHTYVALAESGTLPDVATRQNKRECVLSFPYANTGEEFPLDIWNDIRGKLDELVHPSYLSLSRSRLGSVRSQWRTLRCIVEDSGKCQAFIDWADEGGHESLSGAGGSAEGEMLVKEIVF